MITLVSPFEPATCIHRIEEAARPETFWIDAGLYDGLVYRWTATGMDIRLKTASVRVLVHGMFRLSFTALAQGSRIELQEGTWISRGALVSGLPTLLFFSVVVVRSTAAFAVVCGLSVVASALAFAFGAVIRAVVWPRHRERLVNRLRALTDARDAG
jgi:hypothetical protein